MINGRIVIARPIAVLGSTRPEALQINRLLSNLTIMNAIKGDVQSMEKDWIFVRENNHLEKKFSLK